MNCWTAWTAKPKESKWRKRADAVPCMLGKVYGSRDQVVIPYALTWRAIDLSPKACANSKPFENVQVELKHRISSSSVETTAAEQSEAASSVETPVSLCITPVFSAMEALDEFTKGLAPAFA